MASSPARIGFALAAAALPLRAQLGYPGCSALAASDFQAVELFSKSGAGGIAKDADLSEPTRMDVRVVNDAQGKYAHTDILFVERFGNVKWYDGAAKTVSLMGQIAVHAGPATGQDDNGLMGVAFDPGFETNRWIYLWYSPKTTFSDPAMTVTSTAINAYRQLRLSRFTVTPANKLDMASEKNLIKTLASRTDQYHSGGPMAFDAYGDLWVAVGNNTKDLLPDECAKGGNVLSRTDSSTSAEWGPRTPPACAAVSSASIPTARKRGTPSRRAISASTGRSGSTRPIRPWPRNTGIPPKCGPRCT